MGVDYITFTFNINCVNINWTVSLNSLGRVYDDGIACLRPTSVLARLRILRFIDGSFGRQGSFSQHDFAHSNGLRVFVVPLSVRLFWGVYVTIRVTYTVRDQDILRLYIQRIQRNGYSRTWPICMADMWQFAWPISEPTNNDQRSYPLRTVLFCRQHPHSIVGVWLQV